MKGKAAMKPLTPIIHVCDCLDCGAAFTSRYSRSPYCAECLIDRVVIGLPESTFR